ncbi:hypothetical protein [Lutibacter citreus]|uniref:hypothetical protein n=1 Tax=Lutibacter citreus TaxID=2138210 RepID=UPI001300680A|nr:hypothetical protein [Lutibacter citreus]
MKTFTNVLLYFSFIILINLNSYSQNAYLESMIIEDYGVHEIQDVIISTESVNNKYPIDVKTKNALNNFRFFLDNPFNKDLEQINVKELMKIIKDIRAVNIETTKIAPIYLDSLILDEVLVVGSNNHDLISNSTASSGKSLPTEIIDAMSRFLVERTKQELTLTFFDNFRSKLSDTLYFPIKLNNNTININIQAKTLLPNTFLLIDNRQFFDVPSLGQTWITAFKKDLNNLPKTSANIIKENKEFRNSDIGKYFLLTYEIIDKVEKGYHPIEILEDINYSNLDYDINNFDTYFGLFSLVAKNCTKVDEFENKKDWINMSDILEYDYEYNAKYFLGLIYQQGVNSKLFENIKVKNNNTVITLKELITKDNYYILYNGVKKIVSELNNVKNTLEITKKTEGEDSLKIYFSYLNSVLKALNNSIEISFKLYNDEDYYGSNLYKKYLPISKDIEIFFGSIGSENYGESLLSTISFLKHVSDVDSDNELINSLIYYGNFLVDVINASENKNVDIKEIINNYALPVGSYRIKRRFDYSIDVSAYPGLYFGYEHSNSESGNFGITAPIGFSVSTRNKKLTPEAELSSSSSLFFSIIDIGAPFSYRFKNDSAEGLPENITWKQIFSPGFYFIYGFKNAPLALSLGCQFTPLLREIEINNVLDEKSVLRTSLALMVDIPLFNLSKTNKKNK